MGDERPRRAGGGGPGISAAGRRVVKPGTPRAAVVHRQPADVERQLKEAVAARDVLSLAGAVPADDLFPAAEMDEAMARSMREDGAGALQYGWPEGSDRLRAHVAAWLATRGVDVTPAQILVTSGAQQGLHLLGRLLLPEGAPVAVEVPTYVAALQALDLRRPAYRPVPRTAEGIDLDALDAALGEGRARVLYLVASGHNPTGGVLSRAEREAVLEVAERHGAWVIDDDAYGEIRFGERGPPLRSLGRHLDRTLHLGSFSKVLAPGLRVGWIAGPSALIREATRVKAAEDLETATLTQHVLSRWLDDHDLDAHVSRCLPVYRSRRDALVDALRACVGPEVRWAAPDGGFSLLLRLPGEADAVALLPRALEAGVAFEPAEPYFAEGRARDAVRLSFSNLGEDAIREAVRRLAGVIGGA